ncbi:MAG: hypothetical protein AB1726_18180 [Planctomycetota bacterium]
MRTMLVALGWLAAIGAGVPAPGAAPPAAVRAEGVDETLLATVRAQAQKELVGGLEKHAAWCEAARLFAARDEAFREIVAIAPEHEKARRGLGHRRDADGNWKDPDPDRPPARNFDRSKLKEAAERLAAARRPYSDCLHAFLAAHASELSAAQLRGLVAEILARDPADARAHALLGHVELDGAWVLAETAAARARRRELGELVRGLAAAAPAPSEATPSARDARIGLEWSAVVATPRFRALGTVGRDEAVQALRALHVAEGYCAGALGTRARLADGLTVYLLGDPVEKVALIEGHPDPTPEDRAYLMTLDGAGIPGSSDIAYWAKSEARRVDGVVRVALGVLLTSGFEISPYDHAWVYEGFGLYMTYEILRTRLNWFALAAHDLPAEEEQALRSRLIRPETPWMQEAYDLLRRTEAPALPGILKKDLNSLTAVDLVLSYALSAFLIEAHPGETPAILGAIGGGKDSTLVLQEALGMDLAALEARLETWLQERR